jgi:hypothetical protein
MYRQGTFPKEDDVKIMFLQSSFSQQGEWVWMKKYEQYPGDDRRHENITDA